MIPYRITIELATGPHQKGRTIVMTGEVTDPRNGDGQHTDQDCTMMAASALMLHGKLMAESVPLVTQETIVDQQFLNMPVVGKPN